MSDKNIMHRYDFNQICAGVLRLASDYKTFEKFNKFIEPSLFYENDSSDKVSALREVLKIMKMISNENNGKSFSLDYIESSISSKILDEDKISKILGYFRSWRQTEEINSKISDDSSFEGFLDYLKMTVIVKGFPAFYKKFQEGDIQGAMQDMQGSINRASQIEAKSSADVFNDVDLSDVFGRSKYNDKYLMIGCDSIDSFINGFQPQTLTLFLSTTGSGKTMMAHHLIRQCIEQKIKVFVACTEDRKKSFLSRILSAMTEIPTSRIRDRFDSLSLSEISRLKEAKQEFDNYVHAIGIYNKSVDVIHKASMDYDIYCEQNNISKPVVHIVDYTGHIAGKQSSGEKGFEKMRSAYAARKDYALEHNKICFDFAQVNREGSKNLVADDRCLTHNDLAGGFDIAQVCDNIISLNRSPADATNNKSKLHFCKTRDGESGYTVQIGTRFDIASYDMTNPVWIGKKPGEQF